MTTTPLDQSPAPHRDWLLTSARWLATILAALICIGGIAILGAAIALPMFHERIAAEIAERGGKPFGPDMIWVAESVFALILVMSFLAFRWLTRLRRIIDSVDQGDAFSTANAERLHSMGWLVLGIEALSIPAGFAAHNLTNHFDKSDINLGLSLSGILLALVLFILARLFREGAAMREELEGTV